MSELLLPHGSRIEQGQGVADAVAADGIVGNGFDQPSRGQEPEHPVERHQGLSGLEPGPYRNFRGTAWFGERRLDAALAHDLEHQSADEFAVEIVRSHGRGVEEGLELGGEHSP